MLKLSEALDVFLSFCANLSPTELWLVMALIFISLLYLAYRTMGLGGLLGVLLVGFFAYILFDHDALRRYQNKEESDGKRMDRVEQELNTSIISQ